MKEGQAALFFCGITSFRAVNEWIMTNHKKLHFDMKADDKFITGNTNKSYTFAA